MLAPLYVNAPHCSPPPLPGRGLLMMRTAVNPLLGHVCMEYYFVPLSLSPSRPKSYLKICLLGYELGHPLGVARNVLLKLRAQHKAVLQN